MKILTGEIALREETRGMEQAKAQTKNDDFLKSANGLAITQDELTLRTDNVVAMIVALPEGDQKFSKEILQLTNASAAMSDAGEILRSPDTGAPAIAAETEAIEWLLLAKRAGKGGGGGGSNPGGGNRTGADSGASALALLGDSKEKKANVVDRDINQATGKSGRELPEEFRAGLDRYFEALEGNATQD